MTAESNQGKLGFLKHVDSVLRHPGIMETEVDLYAILRTLDHFVVVVFYLPYAVFVDDFNQHLSIM